MMLDPGPQRKKVEIVYYRERPGFACSFFNTIFLDPAVNLETTGGQQVFRHECYHVQQKHSLDILFMELVTIFFWFNPFFYWARKEIRLIHEFAADRFASDGYNRHDYAELLLQQSSGTCLPLVHTFFTHPIKRRITMILQSKNTQLGYFSRLLAIPLVFLITCAFASRINPVRPFTGVQDLPTQ